MDENKTIKNLSVGYISGVDWEEKPVLIDPYFLGVWLGDGTSSCPSITTADCEIANEVMVQANKNSMFVRVQNKPGSKASTYHIHGGKNRNIDQLSGQFVEGSNPIKNYLRQYDLVNNKHIPQDYKCNSSRVRFEVLAGLIDTDGSNSNDCGYELLINQDNWLETWCG